MFSSLIMPIFTILQWNAQGMNSHGLELIQFVSNNNKAIAVMCLAHLVEIRQDGAKLRQFLMRYGQTAQKVHCPL